MARLIPRKQIEEQQYISSSFRVGEDINIGNNAIVSGSLFVSQSFFLGTNTGSKSEITGSVYLTGSLVIDGTLKTAAPNTILSVTASNALLAVDTTLYDGIRSRDFGANVPTLYVSSTDGNDTNDGRSIQYPLRTIKRAAQLATPGYDGRYGFDTGSKYNGYVIRVQAGTYLEDNPVILPKNSTIWGSGLRITKINAKNPEQDLFWVNSGCYIAEVTMGGLRLWPDQINPERGFGVAFQPGAFITTSPYVQNCSQISNQENSFTELYETIPPGGGGLYVNGDVIDPDSPLASMVLDAYTQISPNGVGCLVNGRGFIQLVSFFNNFSYYAIRVNNGGHATLNNSNISFGLYGMYASGSRFISGSGGNLDARNKVRASWSVIVDVLNKGLADGLPEITTLNTDEGIRATLDSETNKQHYLSGSDSAITPTSETVAEVSSDFKLVSAIVENGTSNFPTLLARSSNKGYGFESPYNILGTPQITSSIASASAQDLSQISASFGAILGIFANGTGSYNFKPTTSDAIKVTSFNTTPPSTTILNNVTQSVSSSFETIIDIIKNGAHTIASLVSNNSASIKIGNVDQFTTGISSSKEVVSSVSSSFSIIYNILTNGTGSNILPIPTNHQRNFIVTNTNSSSYHFDGVGENPTLTLFRGETYKFYVSASEAKGGVDYPFWIRTEQVADINNTYDYNKGVVNNGDYVGNITFTVPYDAPNTLYYVADNNSKLGGKLNIVNNIDTPIYLIQNTLTYPAVVSGSFNPSNNVDIINAYDILTNNKSFIQEETIKFVSSSWSGFEYNEATCRRDVGYIVDAVATDLLYGGNDKSINAGTMYYEVPSTATTAQKDPTNTAVKYAAGLALQLVKNVTFSEPDSNKEAAAQCIIDNREFVQNETIAFLSSSWSGVDGFYYNEAKCKRDVGYILDAVATDLLYGGNERSIQAGTFYYLYPSAATIKGSANPAAQLDQTLDGVRFAAGVIRNLISGKTFTTASQATQAAYDLMIANKTLIQDETIQFINVAYPQLKYNTSKCRRDVGYIVDAIATDLLYGGNERAVTAGRFYYDYPNQATITQKNETSGGIRYAKIIANYIVQNIVLDTPRIVNNDEKNIKVTSYNNITSSINGTKNEQHLISSSFSIIEGIIKKGTDGIKSILAENTGLNWGNNNPLNVTTTTQITNSYVNPNEINLIDINFEIVNSIIANGISAEPVFTSSQTNHIKVTDFVQTIDTAASGSVLTELSASISQVGTIITNGTGSLQSIVKNTNNNVKVTSTSLVSGTSATGTESNFVSSSIATIIDIITNGTLPTLIDNTFNDIKVSSETQTSTSGSLEDVNFISQSISVVTQIIETGNVDYPKTNYVSATNSTLVYDTLKANIPFIQAETIAYLSSSWAGFEYDEAKCKRDVGLIISGAAEDFLFNTVSASAVNGQYYYEFPSQATDTQFNQTLDGINYASRLAQKIIQNVTFQNATLNAVNAASLIVDNKEFIQAETIAYMSSSWGSFDYNEAKCRRDVGYIIDNVATDLIYGGNERTRQAGIYYYKYPSQANDSQLIQTTDAVNYASTLAQKIVVGQTFTQAESNKVNASNLISANKDLIAEEVVAYVSSSWSEVVYNETKCKRDVKYILDAIRTDLVYGGNERTNTAGEFYYLYPSRATVAGIPSEENQLDPTITGVYYANQLVQNIVQNVELVKPLEATLAAAELVRANRQFIQSNTIDYISDTYPTLNYNTSKCRRDVGFVVDGAITDLVYGGNERSITSGRFYYLYPNKATDSQVSETVDSLRFAKELTKLIAIGGKEVENGFDIVSSIIASGSTAYPLLVSNTEAGIKATTTEQFTSEILVNESDKLNVSSSFGNVLNIIASGTGSIPTITKNTERGINRIGGSQITSSLEADKTERGNVGDEFDIVLNIVENGLSAIPTIVTNVSDLVKVTDSVQTTGVTLTQPIISSTTSSFDIVIDIIENGTGSMVSLINNTNDLIKVTAGTQYTTGNDASSKAGIVTSSIDNIMNIITNGLGVIPTTIYNTENNIRVGAAPIAGTAATQIEATTIGGLFDIVTGIVENGTGSMATLIPYTTPSVDTNILNAYSNLKANISFIQDETIAYLSSSWSTASYDESKCRRDVGLIVSGAAEDLLFNANSASLMNGKFYYLYPSQAQTAQLEQTLDGINYAKRLAEKIVVNTTFVQAPNEAYYAKDLLINNKSLIANEVVAYISSSWTIGDNTSDPYFYNEATCKRDVGYILDAVATDIVYGGNERSNKAGEFYYKYPSQATGYQLDQTIDGVRYAKNLAEKIVKGNVLVSADIDKLNAVSLIDSNKTFIANEVVAFVSSSWSEHDYNESKCKRDVGYILDAVKTDLLYGGNERSRQAGEYYFRFPSKATGAELAPTLTGVKYAKNMLVEVLSNNIFQPASLSKQTAYDLLKNNKAWIQTQTIANINAQLDTVSYNEATCKRDVGYIVDAVATDILYGGNERATEAGRYYYLYPSNATGSELVQTLEGIGYAKNISTKIVSNELVYTQITSSLTPQLSDRNKVTTGFDIIADVITNGIGALPTLFTNTSSSIKVTNSTQYITTASISNTYINSSNNGFDIVANIIENGTGSISLIKNTAGLVKLTNTNQYSSSVAISSSLAKAVTGSFERIINIIENGTGSLPTIALNGYNNVKVTSTEQYISASAASEASNISASFAIVADIIKNGTGSMATLIPYTTPVSNDTKWRAYATLKANIGFIQDETIAYLSSSWSTASYDETKCRRDVGLIVSGAAEDLVFNSNSASLMNGKYYYQYPSQAQGAQLYQTLDGVNYASTLAQKVISGIVLQSPSTQQQAAYDMLVENKVFIQNETIEYISSSWSGKQYNENTCKRDIGYIVDCIATDVLYGGNQKTVDAGTFYYKYPSQATNVQIDETVTGIKYAQNLSDKLLRGGIFTKVSNNKLQAKDLIVSNKEFIGNEVIAFISASWNGFTYNQTTCKRDVGYILDAIATDVVYGGNERAIEAGNFYYKYPSNATGAELDPTLTGVRYAKGLTEQVLKNSIFASASLSARTAYDLLVDNKEFIQNETIAFVNSAWSFFDYNEAKCRRDVGYMVDAVATDILYGGNERAREAGYFYYRYPSLATVSGDGDSAGQLGQTLDGVNYAKGLAEKIVSNILLENPTQSELAGFDLLTKNKPLIQNEVIAYISSSWSGVDGFYYNQASCSRDVAYILDNVATDLLYGGNERSSKAGEYYYLYPSKAIVLGSASPNAQKGQTLDGVKFAAGVAQKVIQNTILTAPTEFVQSAVELLKANRTFIQNETIQFIDAKYPFLTYNRERCRRDVGYIVDNVATDLFYGGNERSLIAGDYYYRYPSLATKSTQVKETVAGVEYAKSVAKSVIQNIKLSSPSLGLNTDNNIKATDTNQYTSSISVNTAEISKISSSFSIVTDIIAGGLQSSPTKVLNTEAAIKVTNETQHTSSIAGGSVEADLVTSSFNLVRDIIFYGENGMPDALVRNYNYGFELSTPTLQHISSTKQIAGGSDIYSSYTSSVNSSFTNIINIVNNGLSVVPTISDNTSGSIKVQSTTSPITPSTNGGTYEKNRVGNLYGVVTSIIENQSYPTFISNTSASIKVTNTPQLISGSAADRLQGKLVSSSISLVVDIVLNGTGSQTFVSSSYPTANTNPKITAAYNLLVNNQQMIIDETIAYMSSSWSTFDYNQTKCERDLSIILSGSAFDLLYGGNSASLVNGKFYLEYPSQATSSQLDQTITALRYASGIAEKVVRNITLQHISASLEASSSYVALRANKQYIQSESIAYLSSSWSDFSYNETTCKRDIGYIIDAVSTDLLYGGNERSIVAGDYYFRYPSNATTSELQPTLDGVIYAKGISMGLVSGTTYSLSVSNVSSVYTLLKNNKEFVQNEVVAFVNAKYPYLYYDQAKCRRDIGYIVDAVITDFKWGGNLRSSKAGEFYYKYPSLATTELQVVETTTAIDYARRIMENIIVGNVIPTPQVVSNTFNNIKVTNVPQYVSASSASTYEVNRVSSSFSIVNTIIENGLIATPTFVSNVSESVKVTSTPQISGTAATQTQATSISSSIVTITDIITNGTGSLPVEVSNTFNNIKVTTTPQYITGSEIGTSNEASIISSSIGLVMDIVINGLSSVPSISPYSSATSASNAYYAYNLLKENLEFIQNETIAYISSSWSFFPYDEAKCKRDVGLIISGAAEDMLFNSVSASAMNGKFYYLYPSQATGNQLDQTLDGIRYASQLAQKIVVNTTFNTPTTDVLNAQNLLLTNKQLIQNETIAYVSSSWSMFNYNEASCSRDVAYIIDAATTDLVYGGNERTIKAGYFYYKYPSLATVGSDGDTGGQLNQTLDGVNYASRIAQQIVLGKTLGSPSTERKVASEMLKLNKSFIAAETVAYISSSWVTGSNSDVAFTYNDLSCSRDVNYILDNVATDILYGGNERTIKAGSYYFLYPSQATGSQIDETLEGIRYAGELAQKVVLNTIFTQPSATSSAVYEALKINKPFIQAETIAFVSSSWSSLNYSEAKCKRDVGYIVDAVATDILYGGNQRSATAGQYYFKYPSQATGSQIDSTLNAIDFAGGVAKNVITNVIFVTASQSVSASVELLRNNKGFIQNETMAWLDSAWSFFNYNKDKCKRDVGYIIDGIATDILYGGNERTVMSGEFYFKYPSKATLLGDGDSAGQLGQTIDGILYASRVSQNIAQNTLLHTASLEVSASFDLLRKNKTFIAAEAIAYVSSSWSDVKYNEASCSRDVNYLVDAVATDLLYGGQERAVKAGSYYFLFPSNATKAGVPSEANQLDPTITGVRYAGKLATKVITNPTFVEPSGSAIGGRKLLQLNKPLIQKETILFLSSSWSTLKYNEVSCSRDLGFIIDAISTDLVYGGNERSIEAGSYYYRIPSVAIAPSYTDNGTVGQKLQTQDGIDFGRGIAEKLVAQTQLVRPGTKRLAAVERLRAAKDELRQRAIGYTNGAFPYLVYNEASCSRDTGLIVDACCTDLFYGGNERAIAAASSYYTGQYGKADEVIFKQKLETLETNRYLRTRAEFIAAGAPLEAFGSLIVATGIDYSYNGSGVTFKALPPNQGGSGVANPLYEITELGGGRIYFTSGNETGDFRIGTGLSINQATGTLVGRTFSKSLFSLVTPFSLALQI